MTDKDITKVLQAYCGISKIPEYFKELYCLHCDRYGNIDRVEARGRCGRYERWIKATQKEEHGN